MISKVLHGSSRRASLKGMKACAWMQDRAKAETVFSYVCAWCVCMFLCWSGTACTTEIKHVHSVHSGLHFLAQVCGGAAPGPGSSRTRARQGQGEGGECYEQFGPVVYSIAMQWHGLHGGYCYSLHETWHGLKARQLLRLMAWEQTGVVQDVPDGFASDLLMDQRCVYTPCAACVPRLRAGCLFQTPGSGTAPNFV